MAHSKSNAADNRVTPYAEEFQGRAAKEEKEDVEKGLHLTVIYYNLALYAVMGVLWLAISM